MEFGKKASVNFRTRNVEEKLYLNKISLNKAFYWQSFPSQAFFNKALLRNLFICKALLQKRFDSFSSKLSLNLQKLEKSHFKKASNVSCSLILNCWT